MPIVRRRTSVNIRSGFLKFVASVAILTMAGMAAEACPSRAVRIIVPFPAGGPVDSAARILTEPLQNALDRNVIIENKQGASGSIGAAFVTQQPGDGCTILMAYDTHAVNPSLMPNLPFDTMKDLRSVMLLGTIPNVFAVNTSRSWKSFSDLITAAKAAPDQITYGTGGNGTLSHLMMKLVEREFGVRMSHVPYRGGGPVATAVLGDHVAVGAGSILVLSPLIRDGRIRALAQTGASRHPLLPDVPTLTELGKPSITAVSWIGVFLPASASGATVSEISQAFQKALKGPQVKERLDALGIELRGAGPSELDAFLATEIARWKDVIQSAGIKAD